MTYTLLVKSYWNVDMIVVCESRTQRQSGISSRRHHPPRLVNSRVSWWILAAFVLLKENILVIEKVHASIFTKFTWKRLGRKMDFSRARYKAGHPPTVFHSNADVWP